MASPTAENAVAAPLSEYEKLRLENVKRNQAMIAALGIHHAKSQMEGFRPGPREGKTRKEVLVASRRLRSSTRICLPLEDTQDSECTPSPMEPDRCTAALEDTKQSVSLATVSLHGSSHDNLVNRLQRIAHSASLCYSPSSKSSLANVDVEPSAFSLNKHDIARVVPKRITSASFLPVAEHAIVVAGDTGGHLGFWNTESGDPEGDVVHMFQPHKTLLSGISFASCNSTKIFTCSYDETVKQLDVEASMFNLMYCSDKGEILSAICSAPGSPFLVYIGEGPGYLKMLDTRDKQDCLSVDIHHMTVNTIDVNVHSPWLLLTSSTDKRVNLWDIRRLKRDRDRLHTYLHQEAVHSAQFSPSGKAFASCSVDNTVAIGRTWAHKLLPRFVAHPNKHERGSSTFRAIWGWDDKYIYVGNMKRTIDIISTTFEIECYWLSSPHMRSVPSRLAAHPLRQGLLAGCSSRGEVFLWHQEC